MPSYATRQDIVDRYGESALRIAADRDGNAEADQQAVERALTDAAARIDSYLARRYALPLAATPPVLVGIAVDLALYALSGNAGALTEERRRRHDDAIRLLELIADNKAGLDLPSQQEGASRIRRIEADAAPRVFTRETLKLFR
jgi:phage gp36-like protein